MKDQQAEIEKLISLGYAREDIQVLPDGSLTIVPADEMKSTANAIARATAPDRLERMLQKKRKLDELYQLNSPRPKQMTKEEIRDYAVLRRSIDEAKALIQADSGAKK